MFEPAYINELSKPVYSVNSASITKVDNSMQLYELQLNDQYFQISADMLDTLQSVTRMPDNVSVSIG